MQSLRANLPITIALALSLALHLFLVVPALGLLGKGDGAGGGTTTQPVLRDQSDGELARGTEGDKAAHAERAAANSRRTLQERRERERSAPRELRTKEDEVQLGIDDGKAVTMNWIGYDEYERHLAELAEVEQAAFRLQVAGGSRGSGSPLLPPTPAAPSLATSPTPSDQSLPATPAGSDASNPRNLVSQPSPDAASPRPGLPPTEPAETKGSDPSYARPLPQPEPPAPTSSEPDAGVKAPDVPISQESKESELAARPTPVDTRANPSAPEQAPPVEPQTLPKDPSDGTTPVPPAADPTKTDPRADPSADPKDAPQPSPTDPGKSLNPTAPGKAPDALPRNDGDPTTPTSVRPEDAPTDQRDPNALRNPDLDPALRNPTGDAVPLATDGQRGGGVQGQESATGTSSVPSPPSPAGDPGDAASKVGVLSDSESDPTSEISVPMESWRLGKPLARKGIELKPVRPRFTILNRLDGIGRNPIAELVIGRDGVPQIARILRSTGNPGVDESIRSALFKWRASGAQLEKLKPGQTVTIRLRLIMLSD